MKFVYFLFLVLVASCQSQKPSTPTQQAEAPAQESEVCVGFDQRQCGIDDFSNYLPKDRNTDGMFAGMQRFLDEANVKVLHMRIDMKFYEIVCSACDVCPEQHRFFLSVPSSELAKLKNINLMNMTTVDCLEHF